MFINFPRTQGPGALLSFGYFSLYCLTPQHTKLPVHIFTNVGIRELIFASSSLPDLPQSSRQKLSCYIWRIYSKEVTTVRQIYCAMLTPNKTENRAKWSPDQPASTLSNIQIELHKAKV